MNAWNGFPRSCSSRLITILSRCQKIYSQVSSDTLTEFFQERSASRLYSTLFAFRYTRKDLHGIYSRLCSPPLRNKHRYLAYSNGRPPTRLARFFYLSFFSQFTLITAIIGVQ